MRVQIVFVIVAVIFTVLVDWYIWADIKRNTRRRRRNRRRWRRVYLISCVVCWAVLAVALCLPRRGPDSILPVMWLLYGYLTVYLPKLVFVLVSLIGGIPRLFGKKTFRLGLYAGLPLAAVVFLLMWWGAFGGRQAIEVNRVDISSARLPESFDGYRIAQFSDAHVGTWGRDTLFVSRLVDSINSLKPDLIVFTGDIVNRRTSEITPFIPVLSRLKAKDGVLSILGNHDYGDYYSWEKPEFRDENNRLLAEIQTNMGWKLLNNETRFVKAGGDSIAVIGVENWGEPPFPTYGKLGDAYSYSPDSALHLNDSRFKVLLSHNPEHWRQEVSKKTNVDLTLSGHTHAMQVMLRAGDRRWSPARYKYEQWGGLYEAVNEKGEPVRIYVNIGCGEVGMPYRVGAPSEITLITLRRPSGK
ncbi:MAG: metallophosphoesterase [Muribaculaceae bacterium]|nr:metallophosphoesterase [Muribaculaceae bacterium]